MTLVSDTDTATLDQPGTASSKAVPMLRRAAVIGAGSMGSGIAAHLANAGVPVLLLDVVPKEAADRSALAHGAVARQLKAGGFMHPEKAGLVTCGNVEDDFAGIAEADWIVEAVFEDLAIKQALYRRIEAVRRDGSIVSSNTSTIPLGQLVEGLGERFAGDFVVTHFFNPPRVMQLLEVVAGTRTNPAVFERMCTIGDVTLGKSVVRCRDTPGFIANRIGNYWMSVAALEAPRAGLTVEEADAVMAAFGIPRTGIFGLFDFVGINLVPLVWGSFMRTLAPGDAHRRHDVTADPFIAGMLGRGLVGRGGPGGFYRRRNAEGAAVDEAIDFATGDYRPRRKPELPALAAAGPDLRKLCEQSDAAGAYAWTVLSHLVAYTAETAPEIADDVAAIDRTMRLGYNWKQGPCELADRVGAGWIAERLTREGRPVPPLLRAAADGGGFYPAEEAILGTDGRRVAATEPDGVFRLASVKRGRTRVDGNRSASLWDIGDGVAAFEIHTKMNACDLSVVELAERLPQALASDFRALVIGSDDPRAFSAGANLDAFIASVTAKDWPALADFVRRGQAAWLALKYAPVPVVAAAHGLAFGGGCELMMHADAVVAHAELNAGLPERKVGIIPGWGGATQMLARWNACLGDPVAAALRAFTVIADAEASSSAALARDLGFLRVGDEIVMNRARVLARAKARATELADGYAPPARAVIPVAGAAALEVLQPVIDAHAQAGRVTTTDVGIARQLAHVLAGGAAAGPRSEEELMALELAAILELAKEPATLARLEAMRATNKPLRN